MTQIATITSKNQLTLPAKFVRKLNLKAGHKVVISEEDGKLTLTPARAVVEQLAGSVKIPQNLKGKDLDKIIEEAKDRYFREKYSKKS
ncbi:AbrB/MazE/SpoVT family DNA-binding domain-containing protein [Candidatus Daviesbacteria bacterium]|nr:AbrB/MazE/SpoVT family DNA-binding domain-containing protein [Candidatus Daviesbacteria bacterium]